MRCESGRAGFIEVRKGDGSQEEGMSGRKIEPFVAGVLAMLVYVMFLADEPYWLDAPEFTVASYNLAQAHPPGHPIVCLLTKGLMLLPIGDIAFRANLFSAIFMAVSIYILGLILLYSMNIIGGASSKTKTLPLVLLVSFGLCSSAFIQALSIEVYGFNLALTLLAFFFAMQGFGEIALVATFLGLGVANHHYLTVLAVPAIAVLLWKQDTALPKKLFVAFLALFYVTTSANLYLWARGKALALPAWDDTATLDGLLWVASAKVFSGSLGSFSGLGAFLTNLEKAMGLVMQSLSPILPVLALGGLYVLVRNKSNRLALALALLAFGGIASKVLMTIVDPQNPDDHGYFMPALCALFVLAGVFLAKILFHSELLLTKRVARAFLLGFVVVATGFFSIWSAGNGVILASGRAKSADEPCMVTERIFDEQPLHSVLFLSHYPVFFQSLYLQGVEGWRPDVTVVQTSLYSKARGGRFYAMRMKMLDPDLEEIVSRFLGTQRLDRNALLALSSKRRIRFDPDPALSNLPIVFSGWTWEVRYNGAPTMFARVQSYIESVENMIPNANQVETKRVIVRNLSASACLFLQRKELECAQTLIGVASKIAPQDKTLLSLDLAAKGGEVSEKAKDFCNLTSR
jgi:hypothetical protein